MSTARHCHVLAQVGQAVKRYLSRRQAWRDGHYRAAVDEFDAAIATDSTFALAAIGRADAANMAVGAGGGGALALAARHRERLSARDQLYPDARLGPAEPQTGVQLLARWEAKAAALPDRVEAQYFLAETYMHRRYWDDED